MTTISSFWLGCLIGLVPVLAGFGLGAFLYWRDRRREREQAARERQLAQLRNVKETDGSRYRAAVQRAPSPPNKRVAVPAPPKQRAKRDSDPDEPTTVYEPGDDYFPTSPPDPELPGVAAHEPASGHTRHVPGFEGHGGHSGGGGASGSWEAPVTSHSGHDGGHSSHSHSSYDGGSSHSSHDAGSSYDAGSYDSGSSGSDTGGSFGGGSD